MGLVGGDLQHAVGGGVEDRLARPDVLLAEGVHDRHARGVGVAEGAGEARALDERAGDRGRDRRVGAGEVVPVPGHRDAGELPVAGGGVLAAGDFGGGGPGGGRASRGSRGGRSSLARRMAAPRPRRARFGTERPSGVGRLAARCGRGCWRPRRRRRRRRGRRRSRRSRGRGGRRAASGDAPEDERGVGGDGARRCGRPGGCAPRRRRGRRGRRRGCGRAACRARPRRRGGGGARARRNGRWGRRRGGGRRRSRPRRGRGRGCRWRRRSRSRSAGISAMVGATRRWRSKSSRKSSGPPRAATMRSKRSAAAPVEKALRSWRGAVGRCRRARPVAARSSAPSATVTS